MMYHFIDRQVRCSVVDSKIPIEGFFVAIDGGFIIVSQQSGARGPFVAIDRDSVWSIVEVTTEKLNS